MTVGEVCKREVVIVERDSTVRAAAQLMRELHVGDVIVVDTDREGRRVPVGILTDRDIVVEILAEGVDVNAVSVGDTMSDDLVSARERDDVLDTVKTMRAHGVRRVPVVDDGGGLAGVLTLDDVIDLIAEQLADLTRLIGNQARLERARRR